MSYNHYPLLANVLRYPDKDIHEHTKKCWQMLSDSYPDVLPEFLPFADFVSRASLDEIEEVYTKTFHVQAVCYLDLGYVIFGEDYKRGEFLVNMKREQELAGNDCENELADNLVNILTLFPKIKDVDFRDDLAAKIVIPALSKMLEEFTEHRMKLREKVNKKLNKVAIQEGLVFGSVYKHLLSAILECFKHDFKHVSVQEIKIDPLHGKEFIGGCSTCSTTDHKQMVINQIKE